MKTENKLALVALMLFAQIASADDLIYSSQSLAGQSQLIDGGNTDVEPINDVYTITVTISGPLAPNLNMAVITPQSWVVVCQNCAQNLSSNPVTNVSPPLVYTVATAAVFLFSTDATGKITDWNFAINGNSTVSDGAGHINTQNNGSFSSGDNAVSSQFISGHQYTVTTSGPRGTWTQSSLAVAAATAAPAAAPVLATSAAMPGASGGGGALGWITLLGLAVLMGKRLG